MQKAKYNCTRKLCGRHHFRTVVTAEPCSRLGHTRRMGTRVDSGRSSPMRRRRGTAAAAACALERDRDGGGCGSGGRGGGGPEATREA
eukprot:4740645-Prymnesium_polylepis.1